VADFLKKHPSQVPVKLVATERLRISVQPSATELREGGVGGLPDLAWMLADYEVGTLVEKMSRVLNDSELPLAERVRRSRIFFNELERRATLEAESAGSKPPPPSTKSPKVQKALADLHKAVEQHKTS
jgi:hypothetical protein